MTKRILHVVGCLERGGTEAFLMNHYRVLDTSHYQFDFLVFREKDYPYLEEIRQRGGRVFFVEPPSRTRILPFLRQAVACIRDNGPYLAVHSHVNVENAWVMVAAWLAGAPRRISHSHATIGKEGSFPVVCYRAFQTRLIKDFATDYLACSPQAGAYLYGESFFHKKGQVIHNGIDVDAFAPAPEGELDALRREFGIPPDTFVVGNITRFDPKKNQMFALEVFRDILQQRPQSLLLLGGPDGGQLEEVCQRTGELGLSDRVRFIGPRKDVPQCLQLMDCYLFPTQYEGLGIVLLEAQAAGCPCVTSTEVPRETDMGLELVTYLPLTEGPGPWTQAVLSSRKTELPREQILTAFAQKGYAIRQSLEQLLRIYEKTK